MENKAYDKAKWHYESENFPINLPIESGATHIAFFLRWCIENDFISKEIIEDANEDIIKKNGEQNCREFFMDYLDGVLSSDDLNTKGRNFANAYYSSDKTQFAKNYGYYLGDVDNWVETQKNLVEKGKDNAYFFMENNESTYFVFKKIIDSRYKEFLEMKNKK